MEAKLYEDEVNLRSVINLYARHTPRPISNKYQHNEYGINGKRLKLRWTIIVTAYDIHCLSATSLMSNEIRIYHINYEIAK